MNDIVRIILELIMGFLVGIGTRVRWVLYALLGVLLSLSFVKLFLLNSIHYITYSDSLSIYLNSTFLMRDLLTVLIMLIGVAIGKEFIDKIEGNKK